MKYSQAILVACIGGAALVSALPTRQLGKGRTTPTTNNINTIIDSVGKKPGNSATFGSTIALAANDMPSPFANNEEMALQNRAAIAGKTSKKEKFKKGISTLRRVGSKAIQQAGGGRAIAEGLGNIYDLIHNQGLSNFRREVMADTGPTRSATQASTPPDAPMPQRLSTEGGESNHGGAKTMILS